jgi:cell division septation protein DedD
MSDDGFHEIQLNGKQLVFLFMAATVGAVVIFLCGVMVGRGVRGDQPVQAEAAVPAPVEPAPTSASAAAPPPPAANAPVPEPADDDTGSVYKDLTSDKPTDSTLKAPDKASRPSPAKAAEKAPAPAPAPKAAEKAPAPPAEPATTPAAVTSGGFAVQVTALRDRTEADAIVKRLVAKGYQAYVLNPLPGKPPVYRVQVGRYQNRADADRIASRLQKEEQFTPWVTH